MLRVIGHTSEPEVRLVFDEYYKVCLEWGEEYSADHVYWQFSTDKELLMVGISLSSGSLASLATPIARSNYEDEKVFSFAVKSEYQGIPVFDTSRFVVEDDNIITEPTPFFMTVGAHQILIDLQPELDAVSCISDEKAAFYLDKDGFLLRILCNMTAGEMARWRELHPRFWETL